MAVLDKVLSQVADRVHCQMDPSSQRFDWFQHFTTDILDNHVAKKDVNTGPEDNDRQPDLKNSIKE